jgi:hypothetical protein
LYGARRIIALEAKVRHGLAPAGCMTGSPRRAAAFEEFAESADRPILAREATIYAVNVRGAVFHQPGSPQKLRLESIGPQEQEKIVGPAAIRSVASTILFLEKISPR